MQRSFQKHLVRMRDIPPVAVVWHAPPGSLAAMVGVSEVLSTETAQYVLYIADLPLEAKTDQTHCSAHGSVFVLARHALPWATLPVPLGSPCCSNGNATWIV
jgi:hypothetical protein